MSWTPPLTWTNGLLVAAATLNQHIRDNLRYLKGQLGAIHLENAIDLQEVAPPTSPATGRVRIWNTNDPFRQMLYARFSDGTQRRMTHYAAIATRTTLFSYTSPFIFQTIPLPTLTHSSHPNLTLHNGTGLVAPEDGVYIISGFLSLDSTPVGTPYAAILIDNSVLVIEGTSSGNEPWFSATITAITTLNAGQVVTLGMYANTNTATNTIRTQRLAFVSI